MNTRCDAGPLGGGWHAPQLRTGPGAARLVCSLSWGLAGAVLSESERLVNISGDGNHEDSVLWSQSKAETGQHSLG